MGINPVLQTGLLNQSSAQVIDGSLKFDDDNKQFLEKTFSSGNSKTWTWSAWIKRDNFGSDHRLFTSDADANNQGGFKFLGDKLQFFSRKSGTFNINLHTEASFRDNGWYHMMVVVDTTIASPSTDRVKIYVNGALQSIDSSYNTYPSQNYETRINTNIEHLIGVYKSNGSQYMNGAMSQCYLIDGQALGPESFGFTDPLTNTWRPKKYTGVVNAPESGFGGTVWSSYVTNGSTGGTAPSKAFNGSIANNTGYSETNWTRSASNGNTPAVFDVSGVASMADVTEVKVYAYVADSQNNGTILAVNDVNQATSGQSGFQVYTVDVTGNGLDTIKYKYVSGSGPYCYLTGVTVSINGGAHQELIDGSGAPAGVNGFYLPMDGNSPIGQDQSGNGNNWTPVNFGGSVALDNPDVSGARPILNTTQGGAQAGVGVFGSKENKYYTVTTANGGVYQFDITSGDNPSLEFIRGATYKFDYSSHTGHPILFSSTNPDSSTTAYTTGTNIASNVISFTVPHDAPDTLYYYCQNHPTSMNGAISVTTDETKADKYAANCVLALPLVGSSTDVCDQINCTTSAKTLAVNGNATSSGEASNFYAESFKFDGSGDYLGATSNSDFAMGTGDFTLECWVYRTGGSAFTNYITTRGAPGTTAGYTFGAQGSANGYDVEFYTNGLQLDGGTQDITYNKWHHVAVTRTGTTLSSYVNGVLNTTTTNSQNFTNTSLAVGMTNDGSQGPMQGHLCDVRIYKGVAKYSGGSVGDQVFVVPSIRPDILPDTPSGVSGGSKLNKITDGAVSFDGTQDYLTSTSLDYAFGTGDFTVEAYVYLDSLISYRCLATTRPDNGGYADAWHVGFDANGLIAFYSNEFDLSAPNGSIGAKKWTHVVVTRDSSTARIFVDGKLAISGTVTKNYTRELLGVGDFPNGGIEPMKGQISNLRIIKGSIPTEYQTSSTTAGTQVFTPPTAPLTNVTNTKLLCCQSNTSATAAAVAPANEPFSGAGGAQGRGTTSDYLQVSSNGHSDFSLDGDFTVEWWHYRAVTSANNGFMWTIGDSKTSTGLELYWGTSGTKLNLYTNDGSNLSSATAATGWHHYAVVRNGTGSGNITVYYDGTSVHTISNNTTFSGNVTIGGEFYNGTIYGGMHGPMSQFRFVKGTAVYTSNFTAPTTALTAITNTKILTLQGDTITDASGTNKVIQVFGNVNTDDIAARGDAVATNFNPFNTDINTVRGQESGYCTWNPLSNNGGSISDGNLKYSHSGAANVSATVKIPDSGKWFWEYDVTRQVAGGVFGIGDETSQHMRATDLGWWSKIYGYSPNGNKYEGGGNAAYGPTFGAGDLLGVAYNSDSRELRFYLNGVDRGVAFTTSTAFNYYPALHVNNSDVVANFGQKPFKFPPPDGFQPLNAANVRPETVITRPEDYFNITTWSGDNADSRQINLGMAPDLIWVKARNQANWNWLSDTLRGTANTRYKLYSNSTNGEDTAPIYGQADSINDFGFVAGGGTDATDSLSDSNKTGTNYICWSWKAGGSNFTYNKDGSGGSSASDIGVSATTLTLTGATINTRSKFGIYTYTGSGSGGATLNHGLGGIPGLVIYKKRTGSSSWQVYHRSLGGTQYMNIDEDPPTAAYTSDSTRFGGTNPTSSTISLGTHANGAGTVVLYAWCDVPGLQKFGRYVGNGITNGPYVELGFKPALVVIKSTIGGTSRNWATIDSTRSYANVGNHTLAWNMYAQESAFGTGVSVNGSSNKIDLLSSGFKIRDSGVFANEAGQVYIYMAWAEAPSFNLYGGQSNAR